jgi:putative transposase
MIHYDAGACPAEAARSSYFLVVETQKGPSMRFRDSIFATLLKPISRRAFKASVERHDGDAYDKSFRSWAHLVVLVFAQFARADSLRGLSACWNAQAHHHYHLGASRLARSTLSDANARRPLAVFAETFAQLSALADRTLRREGAEMLRLIDATPIPVDRLCEWAVSNGRTRGLKLHVVYDPTGDHPRRIALTPATVNDIEFGKGVPLEKGATYVFDKAYCSHAWWSAMHAAGALFVTRAKTNMRYRTLCKRPLKAAAGDGFRVLDDRDIAHVSNSHARPPLAIPLRRIRIRRSDGDTLVIITNDLARPARKIASLYKARWQIELLFRWLKQHLKLRSFLGRSQNAIRLQIVAAMIAYLLLRIAARQSRLAIPALRFTELVAEFLFTRKPLARIDKPPDPTTPPRPPLAPNQIEFAYA